MDNEPQSLLDLDRILSDQRYPMTENDFRIPAMCNKIRILRFTSTTFKTWFHVIFSLDDGQVTETEFKYTPAKYEWMMRQLEGWKKTQIDDNTWAFEREQAR